MQHYAKITKTTKALSFMPHISLWGDFRIEDNQIETLKTRCNMAVKNRPCITVKTSTYGHYTWKVTFLDIFKSQQLNDLHFSIMEIIMSVRTSWVPDALLNSMEHYNAEQQNIIKENGYQFSGKFFSPHFTIVSNDISDEGFISLKNILKNIQEEINCSITGIEFIDRENDNEPFMHFDLQ